MNNPAGASESSLRYLWDALITASLMPNFVRRAIRHPTEIGEPGYSNFQLPRSGLQEVSHIHNEKRASGEYQKIADRQ
jgi:hypothetical protein